MMKVSLTQEQRKVLAWVYSGVCDQADAYDKKILDYLETNGLLLRLPKSIRVTVIGSQQLQEPELKAAWLEIGKLNGWVNDNNMVVENI